MKTWEKESHDSQRPARERIFGMSLSFSFGNRLYPLSVAWDKDGYHLWSVADKGFNSSATLSLVLSSYILGVRDPFVPKYNDKIRLDTWSVAD